MDVRKRQRSMVIFQCESSHPSREIILEDENDEYEEYEEYEESR